MPTPCRDHLEGVLDQITEGGALHPAFLCEAADAARAQADAADARWASGERLSPLDGKLVPIKDLFDVKGQRKGAGSAARSSLSPAEEDAPAVARLRAAGAVLLGRTHMTELAYDGVGLNPHFPVLGNALDETCIPGGSSSGAGVAVSKGFAHAALGTDTGGSCRIPAALNGIVGMKPSHGAIPADLVVPLARSFDTVGPLAPDVQACADMFGVLAGKRPEAEPDVAPSALKLGVLRGALMEGAEPEAAAAFDAALSKISAAGAQLSENTADLIGLWQELTGARRVSAVGVEASAEHETLLEQAGDQLDPHIAARLRSGLKARGVDYVFYMRMRETVAQLWPMLLVDKGLDAVLSLTTPIAAPKIADLQASDDAYFSANALLLRNTSYANQLDLCALSLPLRIDEKRSVGVQIIAPKGDDARLLAISAALESLLS